jgi:site-specific DNA-cytosine methylase
MQVSVGVCVSGTFGLPQNRARTILYAARHGEVLPEYPAPTHQLPPVPISMMTTWMKEHLLNIPDATTAVQLQPPLTLLDAFGDLPSIKVQPDAPTHTRACRSTPTKTLPRADRQHAAQDTDTLDGRGQPGLSMYTCVATKSHTLPQDLPLRSWVYVSQAKQRGFGENKDNRAPKEETATPFRAVKCVRAMQISPSLTNAAPARLRTAFRRHAFHPHSSV